MLIYSSAAARGESDECRVTLVITGLRLFVNICEDLSSAYGGRVQCRREKIVESRGVSQLIQAESRCCLAAENNCVQKLRSEKISLRRMSNYTNQPSYKRRH